MGSQTRRPRYSNCLRRGNSRAPSVEPLERRCLPATILTVDTTSDAAGTLFLTLRDAIEIVDGTLSVSSLSQKQQEQISGSALGSSSTIDFDIPSSDPGFTNGVWTIAPFGALPIITSPVTVNGYSQPGSTVNTGNTASTDNAKIVIALSGANAGPTANGLVLQGGNSTVEGLAISGFPGAGIELEQNGSNLITGNFIGTDALGLSRVPNSFGVLVTGITNNTIGGDAGAAVNVISGNLSTGLQITGPGASGNMVQGNLIGLDSGGQTVLANGGDGVLINNGASNNVVGAIAGYTGSPTNTIAGNGSTNDQTGDVEIADSNSTNNTIADNRIGTDITGELTPHGNPQGAFGVMLNDAPDNSVGWVDAQNGLAVGNVISAHTALGSGPSGVGVLISGASATGNEVAANFIGTDEGVDKSLGNARTGVLIVDASNNTIGGTALGAANTIDNNGRSGLAQAGGIVVSFDSSFTPSTGDRLDGNNVYDNAPLGIDLGGTGVPLVNTPRGPHTGPDDLQNYPIITSVPTTSGDTSIIGALNSIPNTSFTIFVYASQSADPSGYGQGQQAIINAHVTTDANGNADFSISTGKNLVGKFITTTATDPNGNTSEFSKAVQAGLPAGLQIVVNTTSDTNTLGNTLSLRQAIELVNGTLGIGSLTPPEQAQVTTLPVGTDEITFDIPSSDSGFLGGIWTIKPESALPTVINPVVIDGYTQPGAATDTNGSGLGDNAVLKIVLDGSIAGAVNGLEIAGGNSTISGLAIGNFDAFIPNQGTGGGQAFDAIDLIGTGGDLVEGNFLGTNAAATAAAPNSGYGVGVDCANNTVGGTSIGAANVISGNGEGGVSINGANELAGDTNTGNLVAGNFIGTNAVGNAPLGNKGPGVAIIDASANTIGGTSSGSGNIIAYGTSPTGTAVVPADGVDIAINTATAASTTTEGNSILGNQIFGNAGLGIDLGGSGAPLINSPGGPHAGVNNLPNYPVLNAPSISGGTTTITGTLNSTPNTTFRIEFFSNPAADPTGYGQGQTFLGFVNATTDASGNTPVFTFQVNEVLSGQYLAATATDPSGNTSEFSATTVTNAGGASGVPGRPVLSPTSDTGVSHSDRITRDDGSATAPLMFTVANVSPANAFVQLYNDTNPSFPVRLGNPVQAINGTATVTLNGGSDLPLADGVYTFAASAALTSGGTQSALSPASLPVSIWTKLKVVSVNNPGGFYNGTTLPLPNNGQVIVTLSHPLTGLSSQDPNATGFAGNPFCVMLIPSGPDGQTAQQQTGNLWTAPSGIDAGDLPVPATATYTDNANGTSTIILTPHEPLTTNIYLISINNLFDLAGNPLLSNAGVPGNYYASFEYLPPPITSAAPVVTSVSAYEGTVPINNNGIPQPDTIAIVFNKAMDPYTINTNTIQLLGEPVSGGSYQLEPSAVAYSPTNHTAYLTPETTLTRGMLYLVSVSRNVTDDTKFPNNGTLLNQSPSASNGASFYTTFGVTSNPIGAGQSPFRITSTNPPESLITNPLGYVSVSFSEPLSFTPQTLSRFGVMLVPHSGGVTTGNSGYADVPYNAKLAFNPNTNTLIIVPTGQVINDLLHAIALHQTPVVATNGELLNDLAHNAPGYRTFLLQYGASPFIDVANRDAPLLTAADTASVSRTSTMTSSFVSGGSRTARKVPSQPSIRPPQGPLGPSVIAIKRNSRHARL